MSITMRLPMIGLGTYLTRGSDVEKAIRYALQAGYRAIDTAKCYGNEKEIGEALKKRRRKRPELNIKREDVFVTTKLFPETENHGEKCRRNVMESLDHLRLDYVDLVLVHYPRGERRADSDKRNRTDRERTWKVLECLQDEAIVGRIGVSNYEICHLEEMRLYAKVAPYVNQVEFHPHFERRALRQYCDDNDIVFQAFSSLGRGNKCLLADQVIVDLGRKYETTAENILLSWASHHGVAIIPKSTQKDRIEANFNILKMERSDVKLLDDIDVDRPYTEDAGWMCV